MALTVPTEEIRALIASLSGVALSRVRWSGEAEKTLGPIGGKAGKITLDVAARATNGTLEPRRTFNATTQTLEEEWGAHRTLTINVRADNFLGHGEAFDLLEKVRFGLELPAGRAALRAAGLAYVDAPSIVPLDLVVDNREVSSASLDVRVAQIASQDVTVAAGTGWIEKVKSGPAPADPLAGNADLKFTKT